MNPNPYQQGTYGASPFGGYNQGYGNHQQYGMGMPRLQSNTVYHGGVQVGTRDGDPNTYFRGPGGVIVKTVNNPGAW